MMNVSINFASLSSEIRVKNHMNTERVKDPEDQYALRVGELNSSELTQSLQDTWQALISLVRRFLSETDDTSGSDTLDLSLPSDTKVLHFDVTPRRTSNMADTLAQAAHEYLVSGSLRRLYTTMAMSELAAPEAAVEKDSADRMLDLLYLKSAPKIVHVTE